MKLVKLSVLIALFCAISLFLTGIATALDEWIYVDLDREVKHILSQAPVVDQGPW